MRRETTTERWSRPAVVGILNVTPDSFSDGGAYASTEAAVDHARRMLADGAALVDVGGESTRPGAEPVSEDEELRRVVPVVEALSGSPVSIDTSRATIARHAVALGARMVNDVSALRRDPDLAGVVAESGAELCLMHMQGDPRTMQVAPRYDDVVSEVASFLEERLAFAVAAGIAEERVCLDPGFGFGKTPEHNLVLLRDLEAIGLMGRPILLGTSRKSTLGKVLDLPAEERLEATLATTAIGIAAGVDIVRVHDVLPNVRAARMVDAIIRGSWRPPPMPSEGDST
jgi:dihydropteroate synthase